MAEAAGPLRIGEFARRVGVTPELLRAWESRHGLTRPVRSQGGFRLYTAADVARVERMRRGLDRGLSAAEAARAALEDERPATLARAAETTRPALVVVSSFDPALLKAQAAGLRRLARAVPLALAGPGATNEFCVRLGARRLDGDLVAAADEVARA